MMTRRLITVALAALLVCAGCAVRQSATTSDATQTKPKPAAPAPAEPKPAAPAPAAAPPSTPSKPPDQTVSPTPPAAKTGVEVAPAPPAAQPPATATGKATAPPPANPTDTAPSAYVFAPAQAATAAPSTPPPAIPPPTPQDQVPVPEPEVDAPGEETPPPPSDEPADETPGQIQLVVVASAQEVAVGGIVTFDVMASSSTAVVDAPLHLSFDPSVMEFVDGTPGDFLTQGGSSVVFLADGRSRPGDVAIAAGRVERQQGASGAGLLCRVRLRGLGIGTSPVVVGRAKAWGVRGEALTVVTGGTNVVVR